MSSPTQWNWSSEHGRYYRHELDAANQWQLIWDDNAQESTATPASSNSQIYQSSATVTPSTYNPPNRSDSNATVTPSTSGRRSRNDSAYSQSKSGYAVASATSPAAEPRNSNPFSQTPSPEQTPTQSYTDSRNPTVDGYHPENSVYYSPTQQYPPANNLYRQYPNQNSTCFPYSNNPPAVQTSFQQEDAHDTPRPSPAILSGHPNQRYHQLSYALNNDLPQGQPQHLYNTQDRQPLTPWPSTQYVGHIHYGSHAGTSATQPLPRKGPEIKARESSPQRQIYDQEELDPSFFVHPSSFFKEGKVFSVLFTEPAGQTATCYNDSFSYVKYKERVFTQVRRFIVMRNRRGFCFACPIFTYGGKATTKKGISAKEHAIAFSSGSKPTLVSGENQGGEDGLKEIPICIEMNHGEDPLDPASRIFFGIHHPIQHNVKVKDLGDVWKSHLPTLRGYWKEVNRYLTSQGIEESVDVASNAGD